MKGCIGGEGDVSGVDVRTENGGEHLVRATDSRSGGIARTCDQFHPVFFVGLFS